MFRARALRATQWNTPAVIVEDVPDDDTPKVLAAAPSKDCPPLPAAGEKITPAQLKRLDQWLAAAGYVRSGDWQASEPEGMSAAVVRK